MFTAKRKELIDTLVDWITNEPDDNKIWSTMHKSEKYRDYVFGTAQEWCRTEYRREIESRQVMAAIDVLAHEIFGLRKRIEGMENSHESFDK